MVSAMDPYGHILVFLDQSGTSRCLISISWFIHTFCNLCCFFHWYSLHAEYLPHYPHFGFATSFYVYLDSFPFPPPPPKKELLILICWGKEDVEQQVKELSFTKETFNDTEVGLLQNFLMRVIHGKVCRPNTMAPNRHKVLLIILDTVVSGLSLSGNWSPEVLKLLSTISRNTFSEEVYEW
jgi:hypothetical protein